MAVLVDEGKFDIHPPGTWDNKIGPKDWWAVSDEKGIIAYAATEELAADIQMMLRAKHGVT